MMIKTGLKSFDITSFNLEIEFNKKVAPITKKIDTLNKNHEKKSLENHKDFLAKEKKSKKKFIELSEKALLRNQRIAKAMDNKLKKYIATDLRLDEELQEIKDSLKEVHDAITKDLALKEKELINQEKVDLLNISNKFAESIASYHDKLATYNANFDENTKKHRSQIEEYSQINNKQMLEIESFKNAFIEELAKDTEATANLISEINKELADREANANKQMNSSTTKVRRDANIKITKLKDVAQKLRDKTISKYNTINLELTEKLSMLNTDFSVRKELIEKDLLMNLEKLEELQKDEKKNADKNYKKSIEVKIDLYNLRANTTLSYEEGLHNEQIRFVEETANHFESCKDKELLNIDKLEVFLLEDQLQIKETGDYFKDLNLDLQKQLGNVERANDAFIIKHAKLRNDYLAKYNEIYSEIKLAILALNKSKLEEIGDINLEIDEINKFIDTAEPLKEIQVNNIRENIEKNEIHERYLVKYAKLNHEKVKVTSEYDRDVRFAELKHELAKTENNKFISDIHAKAKFDEDVEKAKLRHNKAGETNRLTMNSIRLERSLLKSKHETELAFLDHRKELAAIDVDYDISLFSDDLQTKIENIDLEKKYKIEVVTQSLVEDNLKLNDAVNNLNLLESANSSRIDIEISKEKNKLEKLKRELEDEYDEKSKMIDKALRRELRGPKRSLERANEVIDERLSRFDRSRSMFESFINDMIKNVSDESLNNEQRVEIMKNDTLLLERAREFISINYRYLYEAVDFMNNLDQRTIKNKLSTTANESRLRKYKRQLQKSQLEFEKQISNLDTSRKSHTTSITDDINSGIKHISDFIFEDKSLLDVITELFTSVFDELVSLQTNLSNEVRDLYKILTKSDEERILYAEENAINAKELLKVEMADKVRPAEDDFNLFVDIRNKERESHKIEKEQKIEILKREFNDLKEDSLREVNIIEEEQNKFLVPLQDQLDRIATTREERLAQKVASIDKIISQIESEFEASLEGLEEKDQEAKKFLNYELTIYNIAHETAEARYNDSVLSTETKYLNLLKSVEKTKGSIYLEHEENLRDTSKSLMNLTKNYEQNIFAVRPKLEESIGDAQKVIDYELNEKQKRLEFLTNEKENLIKAMNENLQSTFEECYVKLMDNFNFYFDKLKLIRNDYFKENKEFDAVIGNNSTSFAYALFELSKIKHEKTSQELISINSEMIGEED